MKQALKKVSRETNKQTEKLFLPKVFSFLQGQTENSLNYDTTMKIWDQKEINLLKVFQN